MQALMESGLRQQMRWQPTHPGVHRPQLPAAVLQRGGLCRKRGCPAEATLVVWDIENIRPVHAPEATPVQVHRIKEWLEGLGAPCGTLDIVAAANPSNLARLKESGHLPLLEAAGVQVLPVRQMPDAADIALISAASKFVQDVSTTTSSSSSGSSRHAAAHASGAETQASGSPARPGSTPQQQTHPQAQLVYRRLEQGSNQSQGDSSDGDSAVCNSNSSGDVTSQAAPLAAWPHCLVVISGDLRFGGVLGWASAQGCFGTVSLISSLPRRPSAAAMAGLLPEVPATTLGVPALCTIVGRWDPSARVRLTASERLFLQGVHEKVAAAGASGCGVGDHHAAGAGGVQMDVESMRDAPGCVSTTWVLACQTTFMKARA